MTPYEELFIIADRMERIRSSEDLAAAEGALRGLEEAANEVGRAFSGSWLGYHANVYYKDLLPPPPGAHFSQEWGLQDVSFTRLGSSGQWREVDPQELRDQIREHAGNPDLSGIQSAASDADEAFKAAKAEINSILLTENRDGSDLFLTSLLADLDKLQPMSAGEIAQIWSPKGQVMTRDMVAGGQGNRVPPHQAIKAQVASIRQAFNICYEAAQISRKAASHLERIARRQVRIDRLGTNIFIGHGRSALWRELKDFVQDRLHLPWDEFNRVPVAGITNQARLSEMLEDAALALVIMTAEDQTSEGEMQARMNVIHEVGLFQGRLGFTKAIILFEDGCQEFSNIQGIGQIRFPSGNISACFEDVRRVLEREGLVAS
jgi:predicted nucleotide-binding protein